MLLLLTGINFFVSLGFSTFLYLGYRLAPVQQHRLLLIVGVAFAVIAADEFLDVYGLFQPLKASEGTLSAASLIRQGVLLVVSIVLFWYSYSTYYFIIKSSPPKESE